MKTIVTTIFFSIVLSCSTNKNMNKTEKVTFKTITQASYSAKKTGELKRNEVLENKVEKKQFYDQKGELFEYWQYEGDGTIYKKTKHTNNNDGKLIKSFTYDKNDVIKSYTTTNFDENGNIIEYRTFNSKDELTYIQKNEYDTKGNLTLISGKNISSNKIYKTTKEYNGQNLMIKETDFKTDGTTIRDIRTFKYDENGNEIESELTRQNGDYTKFISTYDKYNNILTQHWYDQEGMQEHWNNWEYDYNENKNWITKKRFSNGELGYVWERQIEYN